ncbi:MAG: porin family protein [bacterium]|nr:porin family protein [bacterium]
MKRAVAVLIVAALATLSTLPFGASSAHAGDPFDGSQAAGATLGAALLSGIACWTVDLATTQFRRGEEEETRDDDFDRKGWYVGVSGVYALEFIDEDKEQESLDDAFGGALVDFDLNSRHTGGVRLQAGRRCHQRFSVEVDLQWIDDFDAELKSSTEGKVQDISIAPIVGSIDVKGYLLTGRIQPYALLGVGTMSVRTKSKNSADDNSSLKDTGVLVVRGGGGVDFYLDRNWVLNLGIDYVHSATNLEIVDFLTVAVGAQYRW